MLPEDQIDELKELCSEVLTCEEGGITYALLRKIILPTGCSPTEVDALLCPSSKDGYTSRLYFAQQISCPKQLNWNALNTRILEQNWHAYSWKIPQENLRLSQMVANHLGALR